MKITYSCSVKDIIKGMKDKSLSGRKLQVIYSTMDQYLEYIKYSNSTVINASLDKTNNPVRKSDKERKRQLTKEDIQWEICTGKHVQPALAICDMEIKTTMRYPYTSIKMTKAQM